LGVFTGAHRGERRLSLQALNEEMNARPRIAPDQAQSPEPQKFTEEENPSGTSSSRFVSKREDQPTTRWTDSGDH
jgi:hypothetical protein